MLFLGALACDEGDYPTARARIAEMLEGDPLRQYRWIAPFVLMAYARLAAGEGHPKRALRLSGAADALQQTIGSSMGPAFRAYTRRGVEPAWSALGEEEGEAAFSEGQKMGLEEAIAHAMEEDSLPAKDPSGILRPREIEVLDLAAEGLADAQIAERLYLSRRTVGNHLGSVYRKLGVKSRTAAIRKAGELGLI